MEDLLMVSIRQQAVFVKNASKKVVLTPIKAHTSQFTACMAELGFGLDEPLLAALNAVDAAYQEQVLHYARVVKGTLKNWTPLAKNWLNPTGEGVLDYLITFWHNLFGLEDGTKLPCGHVIPPHTFPMERYNGCPFCGTPFEHGHIEVMGQFKGLVVLTLWVEEDVEKYMISLLSAKTALDASQIDSLKILLQHHTLPDVPIVMKETLMIVLNTFFDLKSADELKPFFKTPTDILRFLWYRNTGFLQIVEPKTIIQRDARNFKNKNTKLDRAKETEIIKKLELHLHYTRPQARKVAYLLNNLEMPSEQICEIMHAKRGMWVRFIRALRLPEYSKAPGFEKLREVLDLFYNQKYMVWQGLVNKNTQQNNYLETMALLKQRPGLFARALFATMLRWGADEVLPHFEAVLAQVPVRLAFTLNMYAQNYFKLTDRIVKPLGGVSKRIPANKHLKKYKPEKLKKMQEQVEDLCLSAVQKRFEAQNNPNKSIFIEEALFGIPLAIGDRSDQIQDLPSVLMGMKFPLESPNLRLFMQWGNGLDAQHLDMDLSCSILYPDKNDVCYFSKLVTDGCKHSGDIRQIPDKIGTAEYIEIDAKQLKELNATYVVFGCNAYSNGSISPNLVLGWMNASDPMHISQTSGVAYDPSCVQQQIRITKSLAKGLIFGVLDVQKQEITWLECEFEGQVATRMDLGAIQLLLDKLNSKLTIGKLLQIKAQSQNLRISEQPEEADEVYDTRWALNSAAVTQLFIG